MDELEIRSYQVGGCTFDLTGSACTDILTKESVAIKKIPKPFGSKVDAKRTIREVKLLRHLSHENIISLRDIFVSPLDDIYLVTELLATDLAHIVRFRPLENQFVQYFFYQIMRALKYIHSAGVVHRDLKPSNILIDENCDLKICDFGLARTVDLKMTGYVTTRFYRAPETMLTWQKYNVEVDMWSAGCILAEMIEGSPLFPGRNHTDQFLVISDLLGSIPCDVIQTICSKSTSEYITGLPERAKVPFANKIKQALPDALDLLEQLLVWNPEQRITAEAALSHPYLSVYHDPSDEPTANQTFDWSSIDADHGIDTWKTLVYSEILDHFGGVSTT
ncbi:Mitogen-activated protein kinase HOG1 [Penicillium subrubescens]|uniref:Mitogen-activated protein kinase HOG1 n=1 Tax=Penicillium subrubescens TaxID=1316194 RepID=UPI00254533E2|nr:Mitogen-activated protein kinase HOG1 [Penicillium subrubescens]KAJ5911260.1 Mitogen-activated protein kinase HOG1 [Penicillium subrubescens]